MQRKSRLRLRAVDSGLAGQERAVLLWASLLVLSIAAIPAAASATEREMIAQALARHPDDVDIRLRYAIRLSREGVLDEALREAHIVLKRAPLYLDAHLLVARILAWKANYDDALRYVDFVLSREPQHAEAILLKTDIFIWQGDWTSASSLVEQQLSSGAKSAELYYRQAQIDREHFRYLLAYRHAKAALTIDPAHAASRKLADETRKATVYVAHEIEYYDFKGEGASPNRFGYGVSLTGELFSGSRFSAALLETVRYRFQTTNHQVGLSLRYRVNRLVDFSVTGLAGAPAVVIPTATLRVTSHIEVFERMDATLGYGLNLLPWPEEEPAFLQYPTIDIGIVAHKRIRLGGGYTVGLLHLCDKSPVTTHSGRVNLRWIGDRVSIGGAYSYGREHDRISAGVVAPRTCAEIEAVERTTVADVGFDLVGVLIHTAGIQLSLQLLRKLTLENGYRLELRISDTSSLIIPAHIVNLGAAMWF